MNDYKIIENKPLARFYYQGTHSHPVRRTVLITKIDDDQITGVELREGDQTRSYYSAKVKSYKLSKIARYFQCGIRLRKRIPQKQLENSTFVRYDLLDLVKKGA